MREFSKRVFGTVPEVPDPVLPVPLLDDKVKHAELLGVTGKVPLRRQIELHGPAASECEEERVRVNIGLDVRPGL